MAESVYKVIELVGTSSTSWEKAAQAAVKLAAQSLRDLRIAEISQMDMQLENGKVLAYRAKVKVSFKYDAGGGSEKETARAETPKAPAKRAPKAAGAGVKKAARRKG